MLCKVHPELYIPPLTQPTKNAPDLYHFSGLGVLCWLTRSWGRDLIWWFGAALAQVWSVGSDLVAGQVCWFGLVFRSGGLTEGSTGWCSGLIWARGSDRLVWRSNRSVVVYVKDGLFWSAWGLKVEKKKTWFNLSLLNESVIKKRLLRKLQREMIWGKKIRKYYNFLNSNSLAALKEFKPEPFW